MIEDITLMKERKKEEEEEEKEENWKEKGKKGE